MTTETAPQTLIRPRIRLGTAFAILVIGAAVAAAFWYSSLDRGFRVMGSLSTAGATLILLGLWWAFLSGMARQIRLRGVWLGAAGVAAFFGLVRLEGCGGDMEPILTWRWKPTQEQAFAASRLAQQTDNTAAAAIDLSKTTENDYPRFLGADGLATLRGIKLERNWAADPPKQLWRQPVGLGWGSFAIVNDFALTQEQRGDQEVVVCYELKTGRERWVHADTTRFSETLGGDGPRATPTVQNGRVYALGATGILNCLEGATGKVIWAKNILEDNGATNIAWGMAGSPLIEGDMVIVSPGGPDGRSLAAYHKQDGRKLWTGGSDHAAYASPVATTLGGVRQILMFNGPALASHDAKTGQVLWSQPWLIYNEIVCSQPLAVFDHGYTEGRDQVLLSQGYGSGCALLQISQAAGRFNVDVLWRNINLKSKFGTMVIRDGCVYGLDEEILTCLDLKTGKRRWKDGRYNHGQLMLIDDLLIVQHEFGPVSLVEATPEAHRELGKIEALSDKTWNNPAFSKPYLLLRNDREAVCYELPLAE